MKTVKLFLIIMFASLLIASLFTIQVPEVEEIQLIK